MSHYLKPLLTTWDLSRFLSCSLSLDAAESIGPLGCVLVSPLLDTGG